MKDIYKKIKKSGLRISFYKFLRNIATYLPPRLYYRVPKYFFERIFKGVALTNVNGFNFCLNLKRDTGISKDLYFYRKREFLSTDYLLNSDILKKGDAVLDIGANIGYYAFMESKLVGDDGIIYAIEPVNSNFKALQSNIFLNKINNINCYKLAAGDKNEIADINVSKRGNLSSFIDIGDFTHKESVQVIRVDDFIKDKKQPSFMRMDVEGFEWAIIEGAQQTLSNNILKNLLIEIHSVLILKERLKKMFRLLSESGFKEAVVIFEYNPSWVNQKGEMRPFVDFLMKKIGDPTEFRNKIVSMSISELQKFVMETNLTVHVNFKK